MFTSYFIYFFIFAGTIEGLTIAASEYIYPNTCNNITCYYESAIDYRTTTFTVMTANRNTIFAQTITQVISSNVCSPDGHVLCNDIGICWCDPDGLSTRICYNHTSGGEGQLTMRCTTQGQNNETLATIAAEPTEDLAIATAEYIYPYTCNNITCYYESAIEERTTTFTVMTANGNRLFQHNIIHIISANVCVLDGLQYCNDTGICWCDTNGLSTRICYNHTSGGEGQLTLECASRNRNKKTLATIAANPSKIRPNNMTYSVNEGSIFGPLICNASCGPPCTFRWVGPDSVINSTVLFFNPATREENGTYQCEATNTIGTIIANSVLIVKYSPTILQLEVLTGNTVNENQSVNCRCDVNGYPVPDVSWIFSTTNTLLKKEENVFKSNYVIPKANCLHTGTYRCQGSNVINGGLSSAFSEIDLFVLCSARADPRYQEEPVDIAVMENGDLNITVFLLAYPKPIIIWTMKSSDTGQDYTVNYNNTVNIVEHISTVNIVKVSKKDYGAYTIIAYNNVGPAFFKTFTVKPQGPPEKPTYILVTCEITSMIVSWRPGSNGGFEQTFTVAWLNTITQRTDYSPEIKDSGQELIQQYIVRSLYPETMYVIHVEATNKHGIVISTENANCTTGLDPKNSSENYLTKSIGASIGTSFFILIVAGVTVFLLKIKKRRSYIKKENSKLYQSTQPGTSSSDYDEIGRIKDEHSYQDLGKDNKDSRQQLETPPVYTNMNI